MKDRYSGPALAGLLFLLGCSDPAGTGNPALRCDENTPCPPALTCNLAIGRCQGSDVPPSPDLAGAPPDLSGAPRDLAGPLPDLSARPDMAGGPPDMAGHPPDMASAMGQVDLSIVRKGAAGVLVAPCLLNKGQGTVTWSPPGTGCAGDTCTQSFAPGTMVTLTAVPNAGNSVFSGWSGACSGTATTCTVTAPAGGPVNVTATFTRTTLVQIDIQSSFGFCGMGATTGSLSQNGTVVGTFDVANSGTFQQCYDFNEGDTATYVKTEFCRGMGRTIMGSQAVHGVVTLN